MVEYIPNATVSALPKEAIFRRMRRYRKKDGRDTLKAEIPPRRIFSDGGREKEFYIYGKNR